MDIQKLAIQVLNDYDRLLQALQPYWDVLIENHSIKPKLECFEFDGDDTIILQSEEYNIACRCHPEYTRLEFAISINDLVPIDEFRDNIRNKRKEEQDKARARELSNKIEELHRSISSLEKEKDSIPERLEEIQSQLKQYREELESLSS